jgi:ATP-dependent DNA helicase RecG
MTIQPYSDDDLDRMLADLETDSSERKESFRGEAPRTVREAVCAFANDLAGHGRPGVVFIGVRDDGAPAGLAVTDELLRQLADIKADGNIVPPPTMTVERRRLRGADIAVITVSPHPIRRRFATRGESGYVSDRGGPSLRRRMNGCSTSDGATSIGHSM